MVSAEGLFRYPVDSDTRSIIEFAPILFGGVSQDMSRQRHVAPILVEPLFPNFAI
jgi:hypothetical protein